MIKFLKIENFKCISSAEFNLKPVTLLTGLNGMGKSSVLQSLLVLQQTYEQSPNSTLERLELNGKYVNIGNPPDAIWEGAGEYIKFYIHDEENKYEWMFEYDEGENDLLCKSNKRLNFSERLGLFTDRFHYLRAERNGPRSSFPISSTTVRVHNQIGIDGEYAAYFLNTYGNNKLTNSYIKHPNALSDQLKHQVEAWLSEISPGTRLYTQTHLEIDLASLSFAFTSKLGETKHFRSTNVGFGITYILPLVLRILSAEPGSLILLENPEAHLHPRGQAKMGELIGLATKGNIQLLVETHSDHLLNGIRLAVHQGKLEFESVGIYFFEREDKEGSISAVISNPKMDRDGRIDLWPDGFFDESEKILRKLMKPAEK